MTIPLFVFVHGDTLGLVVLALASETIQDLAERLTRAAAPRVTADGPRRLVWRGQTLRREQTLREAGLQPMDRVDLVPEPAFV